MTAIDMELKQTNEYHMFREVSEHELPAGYKRIPYQIIFDVKFDLRRKARLVKGGHQTNPPKEDIYSGVVGMDTVRLGFLLIAAINHLDICAAVIGNAFLYGKRREKVYIVAGQEFQNHGANLIIDKGLYGLRSS